ncbi:dihydroneopterin aldolase [Salinifilum aidingensis]
MADRIALTGLRVWARHGVHEHERRDGQEFLVDVTLWVDLGEAAATDDVRSTVHYGELANRVTGIVGGKPRDLIESVAAEAADDVLATHGQVHAAEVTIHKPQAPIEVPFGDVAVTIRRSRRGGRGGQC